MKHTGIVRIRPAIEKPWPKPVRIADEINDDITQIFIIIYVNEFYCILNLIWILIFISKQILTLTQNIIYIQILV